MSISIYSSFGYILGSGFARSFGNSSFNVLKARDTVFHSGLTILQSYQQCTRLQISTHFSQRLLFPFFSGYSHPSEYVVASHGGLACIPLMVSDVEHLFMYLLAICVSFLEKCLFKCLTH